MQKCQRIEVAMASSSTQRKTDYVDVQKMVASMRREIDSYWSQYDSSCSVGNFYSIHKVPQHIFVVDRISYEPIILSIGPYHHGKECLQSMEKEKWHCLNFILRSNCTRNLQDYLKVIARCEKRARRCYSEEIKMDKKSFVQMLLLDGCFVIFSLNGITGSETQNPGEQHEECNIGQEIRSETSCSRADLSFEGKEEYTHRISIEECQRTSSNNLELREVSIGRPPEEKRLKQGENQNVYTGIWGWCNSSLAHDFLLFENQIPFYIVEEIYGLFIGKEVETRFLIDRIVECMESILRHYPIAIYEFDRPKQFHHLLHLCHMYFRPSQKFEENRESASPNKKPEENEQSVQSQQWGCMKSENIPNRWRQAVQYHEAGVTVKKREYDQHKRHSLLDVKFSNGVIEIPCLHIDENTEALFKNLIALEQANPRYGNDLTAYISFMSQLVTTPDDAALLVKEGIIVHMMDSDEELSALFTRLIKQVVIKAETNYYLKSLCHALESHYQSRLNRWMAWLWLNHFSNPWLALAALATVIVLICTVVQTIFTVLAYIKPPQAL